MNKSEHIHIDLFFIDTILKNMNINERYIINSENKQELNDI